MRKSELQQLRLYVYRIYTILCIYLLLSYKTKKSADIERFCAYHGAGEEI